MEEVDAKPEENAGLLPKREEGNPKTVVKEENFFSAVEVSGISEVLVEKGVDESEVELRLQELLRGISEETLQLREFLVEENKLVSELCVSIKQIMGKLGVSFNISVQDIPVKKKVKKVVLNGEGRLILFSEKGVVRSGLLAEYPPRVVLAVLWVVMPKLANVVVRYRKKVSKRVGLFRRLKRELEGIAKAVVGGKKDGKYAEETGDVEEPGKGRES